MSTWLSRTALLIGCVCSFSQAVSAQQPPASAPPPAGSAPTSPAPAQPPALVTSSNYAAVIHEAIAEFEDGNFAEARALFTRAHELEPSARTWRGLGISAFALRAYEDAVRSLEQALASPVKPLQGDLQKEAETLLERAYGFVGRFTLGLAPTTAQLWVDDVETSLHTSDRLLLAIGKHALEARAPSYEPDRRSLDVIGGENLGLSFTLVPAVAPVVAAVATPAEAARTLTPSQSDASGNALPDAERQPGPPLYKNKWLWAGVGAAVVVIAVVVGVAASRDHTTVGSANQTPNTPTNGVIQVP